MENVELNFLPADFPSAQPSGADPLIKVLGLQASRVSQRAILGRVSI
jgi:hypothetical protein